MVIFNSKQKKFECNSRSQNTFFFEIRKYYFFLHKVMEKPYLNLHFKFQDFFP